MPIRAHAAGRIADMASALRTRQGAAGRDADAFLGRPASANRAGVDRGVSGSCRHRHARGRPSASRLPPVDGGVPSACRASRLAF